MSDSVRPLWAVAHQVSLSVGFSRQEYWSGLPFLFQGIFLTQRLNSGLLHCSWILYSSLSCNTKNRKQLKCSLASEWINTLWCIYTMGYYSAIKWDQLLVEATAWMSFKVIRLSERRQTAKNTTECLYLYKTLEHANEPVVTEAIQWLPGDWGEWERPRWGGGYKETLGSHEIYSVFWMWWYICWRRVKLVYFNICHLLHTNYTSIKLLKISLPFPDTMLPVTGVLFPCQRNHHAWVHSNNCLSLRVSKDVLVWESICVTSTTEVNHAGLLEFCHTWDRKGGTVRIVSGPWMQRVISTDSPWNTLQKKQSGSWSSSSWHHGFSSQCSKFLYQLSALGFISKSLACSRPSGGDRLACHLWNSGGEKLIRCTQTAR